MCHKPRSNDGWLLRYKVRRTEFFVILGHFLLFHPPNNPKNPNFEKMKETPGVITLLQMCIINEDRMMYGSWDIRRDGLSFLSFWVIFCTLIHLTIRKNSNFEKKAYRYYHSTFVYHKWHQVIYASWGLECETLFCHFGPFFALIT